MPRRAIQVDGPDSTRRLYTVSDVASRLLMSRAVIYVLLHRHWDRLDPPIYRGRHRLLSHRDLLALMSLTTHDHRRGKTGRVSITK